MNVNSTLTQAPLGQNGYVTPNAVFKSNLLLQKDAKLNPESDAITLRLKVAGIVYPDPGEPDTPDPTVKAGVNVPDWYLPDPGELAGVEVADWYIVGSASNYVLTLGDNYGMVQVSKFKHNGSY